jgi:hypothetical protein
MSKKGSKKNNSNRRRSKSKSKSLLKTLLGGDDGDNVNVSNVGESEKPAEKKSAFDFFDKFSPPKDYKSENGSDEDTSKVSTAKGIFSSSSAIAATAATATSVATDTESESSTGWFIFRVIIVGIIALIFILNMTGYLDDLTAWFTNTFGPYINPILVKIGVMDSTPTTRVDNGTPNKTDNVTQLEQNIGAPSGPPSAPPPPPPSPEEQEQQRKINELKPIPIQPDERQTPLRNKHESARPPGTQPAPFQEQKSREQEKKESIQKALEYAQKNPQYPAPDASSSKTQLPRSSKAYCYIGEDRGHRSCAEVSPSQQCMSGDIFPSMDICVNPRLRV